MRFSCDQCGAQYAIADEKVGGKGVRVKCKKCGNIITVRPERPADAAMAGVDTTTVDRQPEQDAEVGPGQAADGGREFTAEEEEIGSALDAMFGGDQGEPGLEDDLGDEDDDDLDRQATRVFSMEDMQLVQSEKEKASQSDQEQIGNIYRQAQQAEADAAGEVDPERAEWYVAVDEKQLGPMSLIDMKEHFEAGEIDSDTLVWKAGFSDWLPIQDVAEVKQLLPATETTAEETSWGEEPARPPEDEQAAGDDARGDDWQESADWDDEFSGEADEEKEEVAGDEDESYAEEENDDFEMDQAALGAGADVDWQPSALGDLESLDESELAALRPPEEEEPQGANLDEMLGDTEISQESQIGDMDDGDSSIIKEIAAEEEQAARLAEQKRLEEERRAEQTRREEERQALEAQEAARREMEEEKRIRAKPSPEQVLPVVAPRGTLPRWAWALFAMGGVVTILLAFLVYKLATAPTPVLTAPQPVVATGNSQVASRAAPQVQVRNDGQRQEPVQVAQATKTAGAAPAPAGVAPIPVSAKATSGKSVVTPPPQPVAKVGAQQPAVAPAKKTTRRKPATKVAHRRKASRKRSKPEVAKEKPQPAPPQPPPRRKRTRGGILDFEDEAAFAKEVGGGSSAGSKPKKKVAVKKKLPPLSNADVLSVMRQHLAEFKACNRKQKEIDRSVRGRLVVKFVIQPSGKVSRVSVTTGEFRGKFVSQCIEKVIREARFPEFGGGPKTVPFPFTVK